jgi:hypothetical protein
MGAEVVGGGESDGFVVQAANAVANVSPARQRRILMVLQIVTA